jgi:hypothetical protein
MQHMRKTLTLTGIAVHVKNSFLYCTNLNLDTTMKMITESLRSFFEGFASFYTSFYREMKKW